MRSFKQQLPLLVTAAIIIEQGRVLVTRRPADKAQPLLWEFPGGKLEPGESPAEALQRELAEELALEVEVDDIYDAVYHTYDWGPVLILAYRCRRRCGEIRHLEVDSHCWASSADLATLPFLAADQPLILRLCRDKMLK